MLSPWCDAKGESIIPNEGKLLFLGVLNLTWLDRAFVLVTKHLVLEVCLV